MLITLAPMRSDETLRLVRRGDVLELNGEAVDLAAGGTSRWIVGQPRKKGGTWSLTLILPHAADAPGETLFPKPLAVREDGPVDLPPRSAPEPSEGPQDPGQAGDRV